ncbi:MAG: hypothetical protein IT479_04535 [Xanthomonadales bacterium]|nr:hypothetical protein [Xanthomonadales bacterium]MCC6592521.1 hypothetical protein [Xanthomonadales bacterium]MCE7931499.1 hypothetical protein [Xanthomonadales bacterium PRO6]
MNAWLATLPFFAGHVCADEPPPAAEPLPQYLSYEGIAVDIDDGRVVYRESHYLVQQGSQVLERLVLYRCADGAPFARKRVAAQGPSPWLPVFDMTDARLGYREGASLRDDVFQVFVQEPGAPEPEQEALAEVPADLVGDAGFDRFVVDHWSRLLAGETLHFHFLVPSRLGHLGFQLRRLGRERMDGHPVEVFRLALGGLLGLIVSGIDVAYAADSRILLRFEGLSNVRDPEGDNYVVRIEFPLATRRVERDASALEAARNLPLVSTCVAPHGSPTRSETRAR